MNPEFKIKELNFVGELQIEFTQNMILIDDLSLFTDKALKIELIPDESNAFDDPSDLKFEWSVVEFKARSIKL